LGFIGGFGGFHWGFYRGGMSLCPPFSIFFCLFFPPHLLALQGIIYREADPALSASKSTMPRRLRTPSFPLSLPPSLPPSIPPSRRRDQVPRKEGASVPALSIQLWREAHGKFVQDLIGADAAQEGGRRWEGGREGEGEGGREGGREGGKEGGREDRGGVLRLPNLIDGAQEGLFFRK